MENERYKIAEGAFSDTSSPTYLGNSETVNRLVSEFCARMLPLLSGQAESKDDFLAKYRALCIEYADIFSGRNPKYQTIKGYNEISLPAKLRADLGPYWRSQREYCNDDPVWAFFSWLGSVLHEKLKIAKDDDMLLGIMFKPTMQQAVKILLGIDQRMT